MFYLHICTHTASPIIPLDLEDVHPTVVPAGTPAKHQPVMALTRAMTAKLAAQRSAEEGSATPAKSPSSRMLPTPRSSRRPTVCDVCLTEMPLNSDAASTLSFFNTNSNFDINELAMQINAQFTDLNDKVERISTKISHIEESIIDQHAIINELEREISIIGNTLNKLSHVNPNSSVIPSSSQHTLTYFPRIDSPKPSSQPKPSSYPRNSYPPPSRSSLSRSCAPPPRPRPPSPRSYPPPPPPRSHPPPPRPRPPPPPPHSYPPPPRPRPPSHFSHSPLSLSHPHSRSPPSHSHPIRHDTTRSQRNYHATSFSPNTSASSSRKSLLVVGDSNTKYIKFPNISYHRIPTYTIEEIDPYRCVGYAKIWIHVGINNLKSVRCGGPDDVQKSFKLFMQKVDCIGKLSPNTTVIISPILPTGVDILNERACAFNKLLFSRKKWWAELNFSVFANRLNMLDNYFRCFSNPKDKIHLGANGIHELERLIAKRISLIDARSYSAVVKSSST